MFVVVVEGFGVPVVGDADATWEKEMNDPTAGDLFTLDFFDMMQHLVGRQSEWLLDKAS